MIFLSAVGRSGVLSSKRPYGLTYSQISGVRARDPAWAVREIAATQAGILSIESGIQNIKDGLSKEDPKRGGVPEYFGRGVDR